MDLTLFRLCIKIIMSKTYKVSFILSAMVSIVFFMAEELKQDGIRIDLGVGVILGFFALLIIIACYFYLRSEDKRYLSQKEKPTG